MDQALPTVTYFWCILSLKILPRKGHTNHSPAKPSTWDQTRSQTLTVLSWETTTEPNFSLKLPQILTINRLPLSWTSILRIWLMTKMRSGAQTLSTCWALTEVNSILKRALAPRRVQLFEQWITQLTLCWKPAPTSSSKVIEFTSRGTRWKLKLGTQAKVPF